MIALVSFCAFASLLLYVLLGGADFGAGVLELVDRSQKRNVSLALAPVWEANHVWLILVVVVSFVAFPRVYTTLTTALHIPVLIALIGIMARGCAFTFRHYDKLDDSDSTEQKTHRVYDGVFRASSLVVPLFLGVAFASLSAGRIRREPPTEFYDFFIAPWFHLYGFATGLFLIGLFTFVASVFLAAEKPVRMEVSLRRCRRLHLVSVSLGAFVFVAAAIDGVGLMESFLASPLSIASVVVATILIPGIAWAYQNARMNQLRVFVAGQVACIMLGFFAAQGSTLVKVLDGPDLTLLNSAAPAATLATLGLALVIGLLLILPALGLLFWTFKSERQPHA